MRLMSTALLLLAACGIDPAKVPSAEVYAEHSEHRTTDRPVRFAVAGATRGAMGVGGSPAAVDVIADVRAEAPVRDLQLVLLTGDQVARSSTAEWKGFARRWGDVLQLPVESSNQARKPVLALPGDGERQGDRKLRGYGAAFPGQTVDIGFNRVASWGFVDVETRGAVWRLLLVDSRKRALGSRWQEQLFWLPQVVTDQAYDHLLVFMPDPLVTLADNHPMDRDGGPSEIVGLIDDHAPIGALEAVISGGPATNEFFLPTGAYGEAFVVAGNGGVAAPNLRRWAREPGQPFEELSHEALFTLATLAEFNVWARELDFSDRVVDMARGQGAWEGFEGEISGEAFPLQGWWEVEISGDELELVWRMRRYDGSFHDLYSARLGANGAWQPSRP